MRTVFLPALLGLLSAPVLEFNPAHAAGSTSAGEAVRVLHDEAVSAVRAEAESLEQLHGLVVALDGRIVIEEHFRGPPLDRPVNIKSASKSIISALVGRAIDEGLLEGVDQTVASVLAGAMPQDADPRLDALTIGNLLSMQAGLERTSGRNYGEWVASRNWVRDALSRPFVDDPGGGMLYSTGNTHLLSAILTQVSGKSTRALFEEWLGAPLGIDLGGWDRDPQGIYLGGNNMALSPLGLLRFGEMMRNRGTVEGERILTAAWIEAAWTPRTRSVHSGDSYGFGWFMRPMGGHQAFYAWGFGGQMLYVIPDLALTVVVTSDTDTPAGRTGYVRDLHRLVAERIVPAAEAARRT